MLKIFDNFDLVRLEATQKLTDLGSRQGSRYGENSAVVKVMFDTNVFNHLVDGEITIEDFEEDWEPVITHIQRDEIAKTRDASRRASLEAKLTDVAPTKIVTESAAWGFSAWDEAKWAGPESRYDEMHAALDSIKPNEQRRGRLDR